MNKINWNQRCLSLDFKICFCIILVQLLCSFKAERNLPYKYNSSQIT